MPTRIQTDRGRGVFRRFGIRSPRQDLSELDSRVYPVTITEPNFSELASLRHQGNNAGVTLGTNWDPFNLPAPIAAGTVAAALQLSRGLYSIFWGVWPNFGATSFYCTIEHNAGLNQVGVLGGRVTCAAAAGNPWVGSGVPLWNDSSVGVLNLVIVDAPAVGTVVSGFLAAVRHFSDVQDGSE